MHGYRYDLLCQECESITDKSVANVFSTFLNSLLQLRQQTTCQISFFCDISFLCLPLHGFTLNTLVIIDSVSVGNAFASLTIKRSNLYPCMGCVETQTTTHWSMYLRCIANISNFLRSYEIMYYWTIFYSYNVLGAGSKY